MNTHPLIGNGQIGSQTPFGNESPLDPLTARYQSLIGNAVVFETPFRSPWEGVIRHDESLSAVRGNRVSKTRVFPNRVWEQAPKYVLSAAHPSESRAPVLTVISGLFFAAFAPFCG
jgi:hypothetical protein